MNFKDYILESSKYMYDDYIAESKIAVKIPKDNKQFLKYAMDILHKHGIDDYPGGDIVDGKPVLMFDNNKKAKNSAFLLSQNRILCRVHDSAVELMH